ncbi:XK-related protein 5 [Protopterus annectens]|uniref:XK-related protein 5 n=1 Tax=Protopterus annectens TaxID=7888 RepID=UPI001CFC02D4|nr:XK-related protein 5 [Protopterus annectens]
MGRSSASLLFRTSFGLFLLVAERMSLIYTIVHCFLMRQYLWGWLTFAFLLPACCTQVLSYMWFRADGHPRSCSLLTMHALQLGIVKRFWDGVWNILKSREPSGLGEILRRQGDLCVLRLLDSLLLSLPQLLLQTYILMVVMENNKSLLSGISAGLCLLSLSWSLVFYSSSMGLLKPGHLNMPGAALFCQLLWRLGMVGSRVVTFVLFARSHGYWICVAGGVHWLGCSFWLSAQQTDIVSSPCHWRFFNCALGAVHIFCFINVQDSPSRYRITAFYTIMLLENTILLLLSSDFSQEVFWDSLWRIVAVLSAFLFSSAALLLYYSLLHPKSTEIMQSIRNEMRHTSATWNPASPQHWLTDPDKPQLGGHHPCVSSPSIAVAEFSSPEHFCRADLSSQNAWKKSLHHHHLFLVKLAVKTGNVSKINEIFGYAVLESIFQSLSKRKDPDTKNKEIQLNVPLSSKENLPLAQPESTIFKEICHIADSNSDLHKKVSTREASKYIRVSGIIENGVTLGHVNMKEKVSQDELQGPVEVIVMYAENDGPSEIYQSHKKVESTEQKCSKRHGNSTLYFSADMDSSVRPHGVTPSVPRLLVDMRQDNKPMGLEEDLPLPRVEDANCSNNFPTETTKISPVRGLAISKDSEWNVMVNSYSQDCGDSSLSTNPPSELLEDDDYPQNFQKPDCFLSLENQRTTKTKTLTLAAEPRFTSTPKPPTAQQERIPKGGVKAKKQLIHLIRELPRV